MVVASGVGAVEYRDVIAGGIVHVEGKESRRKFPRALRRRRLVGLILAISHAHNGVKALTAMGASWRR